MKIEITIVDLKTLLLQQKRLVAEKLLSETYRYNPESTEGNLKSMKLNSESFTKCAMEAKLPSDVETLIKYLLPQIKQS